MKAIVVQDDPTRALSWEDVPDPKPGPGEVLVEITATALNRADLLQRRGAYPPPPGAPPYLGLEMAGKIAALGDGVAGKWAVGQAVCALLPGGGYAEKVTVPQDLLMPVPDGWSFEQAAAMPEVFYTAFVNLFMEAELQAGETVLIHGGASGVGTAAIQLAYEAGCKVIATAGTDEKTARCAGLGAELVINYKSDDFSAVIEENTEGVDVILDMVGASYFERNLRLLNTRGRLVFIAFLGGAEIEVNIGQLMRKRLKLIGSVLRSRSLAEKAAIRQEFQSRFWPLLENGRITPVIDSVFPIAQVEAAHTRMRQNKNIGKIVLLVAE